MKRSMIHAVVVALAASVVAVDATAQFGRISQTEATTARYDAQRTGWIPVDRFIAADKMAGFGLQWKTKVQNTAANGAALSGGVINPNAGLGISLAYVGASGNRTIGIDMDTGFVFYNRVYGRAAAAPAGCVSASLATPARNTPLTQPVAAPLPAGPRGASPNVPLPFGSVLGEPGEGIPPVKPGAYFALRGSYGGIPGSKPYDGTPQSAAALSAEVNAAPEVTTGPGAIRRPAAAPAAGVRANTDGNNTPAPGLAPAAARPAQGRVFFTGPTIYTYAVASDGTLHALTNNDGLDALQPMPFLPAGAEADDLTLVNGTIYASTSNGCGGAANGIWAIKPAATPAGGTFPKPVSWTTGGAANPRMPAFSVDGTMFVTVGSGTGTVSDAVVSLDPATLEVKSTFKQPGANFQRSAIVFAAGQRTIVAAQAADGRIFLLDGADLSKPLYSSEPVANLGGYKPAALATWQDSTGQRWLLASTPRSVVAYKVSVTDASASLTQGWTLNGMNAPLAPLVVNGVVFALSSGDPASGFRGTAELFAVDGVSGKTLWSSGKAVSGYVPQNSLLWNSMGQVLFGTADSTIYAFGATMERHL